MTEPASRYSALKELILQATARGWCSPENSHKVMDPDLANAIAAEVERAVDEHFAIQLAAISTASIQNTPASAKDRIGRDNPYWTVAYGDVCTAIDREMKLIATASEQQHSEDPKKEAMHIVISLLAAKANVSNETLVGMLNEAEESIKAKRWAS